MIPYATKAVGSINLLGPMEAYLVYVFLVTEVQAFKELVSLEETTKSASSQTVT